MSSDPASPHPSITPTDVSNAHHTGILDVSTQAAWLGLVLAGIFVVLLGVVATFFVGPRPNDTAKGSPDQLAAAAGDRDVDTTSSDPWAVASESEINVFLDDWEGSLTGTYIMTGTVRRTPLTDQESVFGLSGQPVVELGGQPREPETGDPMAPMVLAFRQTQLGVYSLFQVGDAATVVDPKNGERNCRRVDTAFWCSSESVDVASSGSPADSAGSLSVRLASLRQTVNGDTATHRLYRLTTDDAFDVVASWGFNQMATGAGLRCWEARALGGDKGHPWGRRTRFCFEQDTKALVLRDSLGQFRMETLLAETLSATVTVNDLDPE